MNLCRRWANDQCGFSLVELASVSAVVVVLAGLAIPVAHTTTKRKKEIELQRSLREIRTAIDRFQIDARRYAPAFGQKNLNGILNEEMFPEKLEQLVEGVDIGDAKGTKLKYLRRIPRDPLSGKAEWATRSSRDRPDALFTDKRNIFDVHSKSEKVALDGTKYSDW